MAKIKRPVSAILAVLMAASMLTAAPASAAEDASNAGAAASFSESVTDFSEETTVEETTEAETEEVTEAQKPQIVKEEEEAVGAATDISGGTVTLAAASYTYSGAAKKPGVTVKYGTKTLTSGTDYTVAYSNNTNVGTATVTVTGKGSYKGTKKATFKIKAKKLTDSAVTLKSDKVEFCAGNKATVVVKDGTKTLVSGTDYSVSYSNNNAAGSTATAKVTFKGNYTGTVSKTYSVVKKPLSKCTITLNASSFPYNGRDDVKVTIKNGSLVLKKDVDFYLDFMGGWKIGTGTFDIIGMGNYSGYVAKSVTVTKGDITKADIRVSTASNCLYDNGVIKSLVNVSDTDWVFEDLILKRNKDYTITFGDDDEGGIVTYTVKGIGDYTGSYSGSFLSDEDSKYFATRFVWGRDNWSFGNSSYYFSNGYSVNDTVKNGMMSDFKLNNNDKGIMGLAINEYKSKNFAGSCYGMTSSALIFRKNNSILKKYTKKTQTNQVEASKNGTDICNYFQISWAQSFGRLARAAAKCVKSLEYVQQNSKPQKDYVSRLESVLKNQNEAYQLIFRIESADGDPSYHAVIAYGTEKYSYTHRFPDGTTKKYDKRILICDPNTGYHNAIIKSDCVYYNSKDKSWIIPSYTSTVSSGSTCYWNSDMGTSISKGSLSGIIKYYSVTCSQDMMSGYKYDYTKDVWDGSEVGASMDGSSEEEDSFSWEDQKDYYNYDAPFVNIGDVNGDG
ncbi:MAG: hypothetical protein II190_02590, partial [Ruminococcus sp.]|nr:hypothetical protein [Ruminococcus sp.]